MFQSIKKAALVVITISSLSVANAQTTATGWYDKGMTYFNDQKYEDAVVAFEKATSLNPKYDAAFYRAGWCYNDLEEYSKAIDKMKKAVAINKDYAEAWQEMGYAYKPKFCSRVIL